MLGALLPMVLAKVLPALGAVSGWPTGKGRPAAVTLGRMADVVNRDVEKPEVIETAARIVAGVDGRDALAQAAAVNQWLRANTRFLRDPTDQELLREPAYMLYLIRRFGYAQGDCDDLAMLSAALLKSIGFSARFYAEAYHGGPLSPLEHVYTAVGTQAGRRRVDTQIQPNEFPRYPVRRIFREV